MNLRISGTGGFDIFSDEWDFRSRYASIVPVQSDRAFTRFEGPADDSQGLFILQIPDSTDGALRAS
jgi:hypothetical protein